MLTKNEITALNLSPTKKDFVQIWNELLEVAGKLSERWDPTSTNESDPGIVILKALTGIADKLNYNIDKNTLEAFMPTVAQEDSMRKLCDMLGYNIKYYRSAETNVNIKYYNSDPSEDEINALKAPGLLIPKFTVITNSDQDISYFTTNQTPLYISSASPHIEAIPCMEGQIVKCESTADNNVITNNQISEQNRFYMPEAQIAENGIFIYNVVAGAEDGMRWEKVDNLNVQARGSRVFKFGYDSYEGRPYVEFPEDYSELINDGLFIYYARTSGANGNVSARTLTQLELPNGINWDKVSAESFSVENVFSATTGANLETISQAYNNFKKTIGTFETLVTCRDYMNKIYTMIDDNTGNYLVSNVLATDIRTDLNRAITICSCGDAGIFYKDTALITDQIATKVWSDTDTKELIVDEDVQEIWEANEETKPIYSETHSASQPSGLGTASTHWFLGSIEGAPLFDRMVVDNDFNFSNNKSGEVFSKKEDGTRSDYWIIKQDGRVFTSIWPVSWSKSEVKTTTKEKIKTITNETIKTVVESSPAIDHFDLVIYPFKSYNQIRSNVRDIQEAYDASFKYNAKGFETIKTRLNSAETNLKTIAHNIISPRKQDIISINNYLRLNAIIGTNLKITAEEGAFLIDNVKVALANAFNMRELDFGEEIPFDSIVEVIEKADPRIKVVPLAEPALYTTYSILDDYDDNNNPVIREYAVASKYLEIADADKTGRFTKETFDSQKAKTIYNKLAIRNVLAGRVPLLKYNNTFKTSFAEGAYRITSKNIAKADLPGGKVREQLESCTAENPFVIWVDGSDTYTAQYNETDKTVSYTKTYIPQQYANNIIAKEPSSDNNFNEITTSCKIKVEKEDNNSVISDVTLTAGEVIKFRAPNFITDKTFPAYVNYYLDLALDNEMSEEAEPAEAYTLYDLLNTAILERGVAPNIRRQRVLDYFKTLGHKQTFTLTQTVYGKDIGTSIEKAFDLTASQQLEEAEKDPIKILAKSGFVKLVNEQAKLSWEKEPVSDKFKISIPPLDLGDTSFIANSGVFTDIKRAVDTYLEGLSEDVLPTKNWLISYTFEYVPFEAATLADWQNFIKANGQYLFGFRPAEDRSTVLWHSISAGNSIGKYVLSNTSKLATFTSGDFGHLDSANYLSGIYVAESLGKNPKPNYIKNNTEYKLQSGEYLYIEYTPSTTTAEGTTQESVTEIFGKGTIIRPSGFEKGLVDSKVYGNSGHSSHKKVAFEGLPEALPVYSMGASEQIEIRDFARVELNKKALPNSSGIYIYKNFNNCPKLESIPTDGTGYRNGERINSSYTLKDGEYIFYTDQNKSEFAYYTSGTEITLTGRMTLPVCEIIDLSAIFDNGIQEIPWVLKNLTNDDGIIFQEYQYVTLGSGDTLKKLTLKGDPENSSQSTQEYLDSQWQGCLGETSYILMGEEKENILPIIDVSNDDSGNGWEACSILELDTSPNSMQILRKTEQVEDSVILYREASSETITLKAEDAEHPLAFKPNLVCQSGSGQLTITDIYANPDKLKSFEFKIFAEEPPAIVKTEKDSLIPCQDETVIKNAESFTGILGWPTSKTLTVNEFGTFWQSVAMTDLAPVEETENTKEHDNALKLTISTLPNTYGIFSIYLNYYNSSIADTFDTWIELLPGTSAGSISLFNVDEAETVRNSDNTKLFLKPGINCIRVDTTTDLFIKTTASDGILYFDNVQLVDCQPVEVIEKNGQRKLRISQGLNLEQIGYLDTSDTDTSDTDTFNVFDMYIRKKHRKELTEKALAELDVRARSELKKSNSLWAELQVSKPKLEDLVLFFDNAKQELDTLLETSGNINGLFKNYKEVCEDLKLEEELKKALDSNQTIDSLIQQLSTLLETFTSEESLKQKLFRELDTLEKLAIEKAASFNKDTLAKGDILRDFEIVPKSLLDTRLLNDLKLASIKEINTEYSAHLALLSDLIKEIDESELQGSLVNILDNINATKHLELINQISALLEANQDSLETAITEAKTIAVGATDSEGKTIVQYSELANKLISLKDILNSIDSEEIASQIDSIANSNLVNSAKYTELLSLVGKLQTLLDKTSSDVGDYRSLIKDVDILLSTVQTKLITGIDNAFDIDLFNDVAALSDKATEIYTVRLSEILDDIAILLTRLKVDTTDTIDKLRSSNIESVQAVLSNLTGYTTIRTSQLVKVSEFTLESNIYSDLPHAVQSILTVWPEHMKQSFITGIDNIYKEIRKVIEYGAGGTFTAILATTNFYAGSTPRQVLVNAADIKAFQELFERAKNQNYENTQNSTRMSLINELGKQLQPSDKLTDAMNSLKNDNRIAVLGQIINELQKNPTITEKQKLINAFKAELDTAIDIDAQLVEVSAKLLCPSILLFEKEHPEKVSDNFYSKLKKLVSDEKENLLKIDTDTASASQDLEAKLTSLSSTLDAAYTINKQLYNAFKTDKASNFTGWASLESTLLEDNFITNLEKLKEALAIQELIIKIKDSEFFNILKNESLSAAWQDTDGRWLDSSGNYFKTIGESFDNKWQTISGEWVTIDVKRNKNGTWVYNNNDEAIDLEVSIDANNIVKVGSEIITDKTLVSILKNLLEATSELGQAILPEALKNAYSIWSLENQLLSKIRAIDKNREFYYNVPTESNVVIDFNGSDISANTLMNPAIYYDINNVNNNFVISKIDINYLDKGLQIARSSKLS